VGDISGSFSCCGNAVYFAGTDAAVLHGIQGRVCVKLDLGKAGNAPEIGGLGRSDNGNRTGLHG
tara:strand:- start:199 stop:390 length:192 start_codon:yes stop_codon:yes gene_type:complete